MLPDENVGFSVLINNSDYAIIDSDSGWTWSHYIRALIFFIIIFCTILGNVLVLLSIFTHKQLLYSSTNFFIANLAFADLLVGIFVLPILATYQLTDTWYFGQDCCLAWICVHFWLCSASILSICAICLDRYIGVRHPLKHYTRMCPRNAGIIIVFVWIMSCILSLIPIFVWPEPPSEDPMICRINQQFGHVIVATVGILYIPTVIMISFYWLIYKAAVRHLRSIRRGFMVGSSTEDSTELRVHKGSIVCISDIEKIAKREDSGGIGSSINIFNGNPSTSASADSRENLLEINLRRQTMIAKKLAVVVGVFVFSYFPFFTLFLIRSFDESLISIDVFNIFGWIRYFNCCLNPMIYAAMLPHFRVVFKQIIRCRRT